MESSKQIVNILNTMGETPVMHLLELGRFFLSHLNVWELGNILRHI